MPGLGLTPLGFLLLLVGTCWGVAGCYGGWLGRCGPHCVVKLVGVDHVVSLTFDFVIRMTIKLSVIFCKNEMFGEFGFLLLHYLDSALEYCSAKYCIKVLH